MFSIEPNKFYAPKEVAEIFGVAEITIRRWIADGKLPVVEINGRYYVGGTTIIALIKASVRVRQMLGSTRVKGEAKKPLDDGLTED